MRGLLKNLLLFIFCFFFSCRLCAVDQSVINLLSEGNGLYVDGNYSGAKQKYLLAISSDYSYAYSHANLALAMAHLGEFSGAETCANTAISLDASHKWYHLNKGKILAMQDKNDEAISSFTTAIGLDSNFKEAFYNRAWCQDEKGDYPSAVTDYQSALAVDPEYGKALLGLAITKAKQNLNDEAVWLCKYSVAATSSSGKDDMLNLLARENLRTLRGTETDFTNESSVIAFNTAIAHLVHERTSSSVSAFSALATAEPDKALAIHMHSRALMQANPEDPDVNTQFAAAKNLLPAVTVNSNPTAISFYLDGHSEGNTTVSAKYFSATYDRTLKSLPNLRSGTIQVLSPGPTVFDLDLIGSSTIDLSKIIDGPAPTGSANALQNGESMTMNLGKFLEIKRLEHFGILSIADCSSQNFSIWGSGFYAGTEASYSATLSTDSPNITITKSTASSTSGDEDFAFTVSGTMPADYDPIDLEIEWTTPQDSGTTYLRLFSSSKIYYVNDNSITNDAWCTAIGDDHNSGLNPGQPKASVQSVFDSYDLEPGDIVRIDSGNYTVSSDITPSASDSGSALKDVIIEASPYGVTMQRSLIEHENAVFHFVGGFSQPKVTYMKLRTVDSDKYPNLPKRYMKISGAYFGANIENAGHLHLEKIEFFNNFMGVRLFEDGFYVECWTEDVVISNCIIHSNTGYGILSNGLAPYSRGWIDYLSIENCTILDNDASSQLCFLDSRYISLKNNIIGSQGQDNCIMSFSDSNLTYSNYNDFWLSENAKITSSAESLADWKTASGLDVNSISANPSFADSTNGDFHLLSNSGRYNPISNLPPENSGSWSYDANSSICIDSGNPAGTFMNEPMPNGSRINLGAYGNTAEASKTGSFLVLSYPNGGEFFNRNTSIDIIWTSSGIAGNIKIELFKEGCLDSVIVADTSNTGSFTWSIGAGLDEGNDYKIMISSLATPSLSDSSDGFFNILDQATLTITKVGNGTVSPDIGAHQQTKYQIFDLSATADSGYVFAGWTGDANAVVLTNTENAQAYITGNATIRANFLVAFADSGQTLWGMPSLADLDGDGDLDVFGTASNGCKVFFNNGTGTFSDSGQLLSSKCYRTALGDFDGDGDFDAFIANYNSPTAPSKVFFNDGSGIFTDSGQSYWQGDQIVSGDIDGDGDIDAIISIYQSSKSAPLILINNGAGVFTQTVFVGDNNTRDMALLDADSDGDLDLVVANGVANRLYMNDGAGNFTDSGQIFGATGARGISTGDLDADGDEDIIITEVYSGSTYLKFWCNNGNGVFTDTGQNILGKNTYNNLALADLDGDGDLDAICASYYSYLTDLEIFVNDGKAMFSLKNFIPDVSNGSIGIGCFGDIDSDYDVDLIYNTKVLINANNLPGSADLTINVSEPGASTIPKMGTYKLLTLLSHQILTREADGFDFQDWTNTANSTIDFPNRCTANIILTGNSSATANFAVSVPEMNVKGNGVSIADGDTTPGVADDTDFGSVNVSSGSVVKIFIIENSGSANLALSGTPPVQISGANASDFTVTSLPSSPLSPSGSTTFLVTFDPSGYGARTAEISIANNDSNENPYNFSIKGTGTNSSKMTVKGNSVLIVDGDTTPSSSDFTDFGSAEQNTGLITKTFYIYNTGNQTLNLTGTPLVEISGTDSADFVLSSPPSATVAASGNTSFTVNFNPSSAGLKTATLTISNNSPDTSPYEFAVQGTGTVSTEMNVVGNAVSIADGDTTPSIADDTDFSSTPTSSGTISKTFTIQNLGSSPLILTGNPTVVVGGTAASEFTVTSQPSPIIPPVSSTTFTVVFAPTSGGTRSASISIDNNDSNENPYNFNIAGTGISSEIQIKYGTYEIADGDITPSSTDGTDFGNAEINTGIVSKTFTINNLGFEALDLTGTPIVQIGGDGVSSFTVTIQPSSQIAMAGNSTFTIEFNPSSEGLKTATVSIANDDTNENPFDFSIQGTGTLSPVMNVKGNGGSIADGDTSPSLADYTYLGILPDGSTDTINRTFVIENIGSSDLTLNGTPIVAVGGTNAADFEVTVLPASLVSPLGSTTFEIRFTPNGTGLRNATLSISNNDSGRNPYNFNICASFEGLIARFPFNGNSLDSSNNGNDGMISGAILSTDKFGKLEKCYYFDGVDDEFTFGSNGQPFDNFSFGGWIKTDKTITICAQSTSGTTGTSGQNYAFDPICVGTTEAGAGLSVGTNGIQVFEHAGSYLPPLAVYNSSVGSGWNHVFVVYTAKKPTIFLNGALVWTGYSSTKKVWAPLKGPTSSSYGKFRGSLDNLRVYNRPLDTAEVSSLYQLESGHSVQFSAGANGSISGTLSQIVEDGDSTSSVAPVPDYGFSFSGWSGDHTGTENPLTIINVRSDKNITANFAVATYTLSYSASGPGTISGSNPQIVNHGGNGTQVTAVANPGFRFIRWNDGLLTVSRTDSNITANLAVTAIFAEKAVWDFNGDGKSDVLCENEIEDGFIYFMNGHLVALSSEVYKKTDTDWKIAKIADFNGDDKADILWEHQTSGQILLYIMNGSVISSVKTLYAGLSGGIGWTVKDLADFNGDGKADILWEHSYGYGYIALMDGNIVAGGGAVYARSPNTKIEKIADFSGDGKADILWELEDGTGYVFVMNGSSVASEGAIYSRSPQWQIVEYGDFNGDAKTDILWEHSNGTGYVYLMNGSTISSHGYAYKKSDIGWTVKKIGDFNGDGKDDLLWEHSAGIGCVYLMNGLVIADYHNIYSLKDINPATRWDIVKILDFNGDGKSDMLWESAATKKTLLYLMNGLAVSATGTVYCNGAGWNLISD